jgi:hypothetical protein
MADLKKFESDLRAEHAALTQAYEAAHVEAEATWAAYEAHKVGLTTFRSKYGTVLKALAAGAVTVET